MTAKSKIILLAIFVLLAISLLVVFVIKKADQRIAAKSTAHKIIPRKVIFGNPEKTSASLSKDGSKISFLAPVDRVLNVWVTGASDIKLQNAKPVTKEKTRSVRGYLWPYNSDYLLYFQDQKGDENYHIFSVNLKTGKTRDLTPFPKTKATIYGLSPLFPDEILIGMNKRDPKWFDIYRLNIATGKLTLVEENNEFVGFLTDGDLNLRIATKYTDGFKEYYVKNSEGKWELYEKVPAEDRMSTSYRGFNKKGDTVYKVDTQGRDKAAIYAVNLASKKKTLIAENDKADCEGMLIHPSEWVPQAYSYDYTKSKWGVLDDRIKKDFDYLRKRFSDDFGVGARTLADDKWIISHYSDDKPSSYYLYKRDPVKNIPLSLDFLFTTSEVLNDMSLVPLYPVIIKSRDGLDLVSYLSLPDTVEHKKSKADSMVIPSKPLPMVLLVHGGPWARDYWGFDSEHQWLANRGYAVLSVNFRGSTGFGKSFTNAGNKEWGRKMHDDLIDAVNWAIENKIADPKKIAIMGGSYGGYAALAGLTFTPDVFCCGVSEVGPSNLITLMENMPPYWLPVMDSMKKRVGDIDTKDGRKLLKERSPLTYVDRIKKPLLVIQGEHDPRVKKVEADQIVNKMREKNIPVTYVLYHDEGHGLSREQNRVSSRAIIEEFLTENLGGYFEPVKKEEFEGANFTKM